MASPIVLIIFNRPDTTYQVIKAVRQAKPSKLLVIADGPRLDRPQEVEKCNAARAIIDQIDWDCEVLKNYSDVNLGCANRVFSGLDWAFSLAEEVIILEDDCIPHPTFFQYCDKLLDLYRHDTRIMSICGLSVPKFVRRDNYSYHFSRYQRCWGWATWKRAWQYYDHSMAIWPQAVENDLLSEFIYDPHVIKFWYKRFQDVYDGKIDSWAYRWMFACWMQSGLSILPNTNLISNIGTSADATHTVNDSFAAQLSAEAMSFPLSHPPFMLRDQKADSFIQRTRHSASLGYKVKNKLKRIFNT